MDDTAPEQRDEEGPTVEIEPWVYPLVILGLAVPIVGAFMVGGPVLGLAVGFLAAAVVALVAARMRPRYPIDPPRAGDRREHILVVAARELEDPETIDSIMRTEATRGAEHTEILVLAPAVTSALDRWATDVSRARLEAQRKLVVSVASLAGAHFDATGEVGDENLVQAVEDALRTFPATRVVLLSPPSGAGAAVAELADRLTVPFREVPALAPRAEHPAH